jgi:hypothetical protein
MNLMNASDQAEVARLRQEVERLQAQLKARQAPSDLAQALITNTEFLADMARFAEGLASEKDIRKKHRLAESEWTRLGNDDELIETIKREKERRIRNGLHAREKAQQVFVKAPAVLDEILSDKSVSPRHRIESSRELRAIASVSPETVAPAERFVITINLGNNEVIHVSKPITPGLDDNGKVIEQKPLPMIEEDSGADSV